MQAAQPTQPTSSRLLLVLALGLAVGAGSLGVALGEEETPVETPSPFADFAWLSGTWRGEVEGDLLEEHWGEPLGPSFAGMFRWIKGDRVYLYEMLAIEKEGEATVLRILHLAPGLVAPESEKDGPLEWRLVSNKRRKAVFEDPRKAFPRRIVYHRTEDSTLVVSLEGADAAAGQAMAFRFTRHVP